MLRIMLVAAFVMTMSGCANNKPNPWEPIDLSGYTKVTEPQVIEVPETLDARRMATSWTDVDQDMGILAGSYVATLESPTAVLYLGKGRTNYWLVGGQYFLREGGIWVSKSAGEAPKLFWFMGENRSVKAPTLEAAIKLEQPLDTRTEYAYNPALSVYSPIAVGIITAMTPTDADFEGKFQTYAPLYDQEFLAKLAALVGQRKPLSISVGAQ